MNRIFGIPARWASILAILAIVASGCGDDGDDTSGGAGTTRPTETENPDGGAGSESGPGTPEPQPLPERTQVTITAAAPVESLVSTLLVADATGEFDQENLDVEFAIGLETNAALIELDAGRMQMAITGISASAFSGVAGGAVDTRFVSDISSPSAESLDGLYVQNELIGDDGEVEASQVEGMRLAVGAAGVVAPLGLHVLRWLEQYDVSLDDVEFAPVGGPDILVALEQGAVDAGYLTSPFWQEESVGECCTLVTEVPSPPLNKYAFSADFLENERDVAKAILRALIRTNRTYLQPGYHDDPEVIAILADGLGVPEDALANGPEHVFDPSLGIDAELVMEAQDLWLEADQLEYDEPLSEDEVIDTSIVDEILAE